MKLKLPPFLALSYLVLWLPHCYGTQFEKSGLPCVAEICIGDGIEELAKVNWNPAEIRMMILPSNVRAMQDVFRGDIKKAIPFLYSRVFDSTAIPLLPKVTVRCSVNGPLVGTFTTEAGNLTHVKIDLVPDFSNVAKQRWVTTEISRSYPAAVTEGQRNEVMGQLVERYGKFNSNSRSPKLGEGLF